MAPEDLRLRILRNLDAGRDMVAGLPADDETLRAAFNCVADGYVSRGRITPQGRAYLEACAPRPPIRVKFEARVVERARLFLAPAEGPAEVVEYNR